MEIARAMETEPASGAPRRFLVTANDDDRPLKSKQYETVWELTTARAVTVVRYLVSLGVPATALTAAGTGSFDPLVPNDNQDDRARNRRVEISLLSGDEAPTPATPAPAPPTSVAPRL
jgi:flagellar motor protein MotB